MAALAVGCLIAPQLDQALHPSLMSSQSVLYKLWEAHRLDGELRAAIAVLVMHTADKVRQCGQDAPSTAGTELRLRPEVMHAGEFKTLSGCWVSTAAMKNARSGDDLSIELCFNGRDGTSVALVEPSGNRCSAGQLRPNLRRGLEMAVEPQSPLQCADGKTYTAPSIICRPGPDFIANCLTQAGSVAPITTRFTRK